MNIVGKAVVSVISVLLVVGVALAVVVVVHHQGNGKKDGVAAPSSSKSMVESVCSNTDYKEACEQTLKPLSHNLTADYKDFIKAAVQATVDQVTKSLNLSESLLVEASKNSSSRLKMSLEDCNDLLSLAISQLQASFSMVGDSNVHTIQDRSAELKSWLSSVISYAETCVDGVEEPKFQASLTKIYIYNPLIICKKILFTFIIFYPSVLAGTIEGRSPKCDRPDRQCLGHCLGNL